MFMGDDITDDEIETNRKYYDDIQRDTVKPRGPKPWTPTHGTDRMAQKRNYRGKGPEST